MISIIFYYVDYYVELLDNIIEYNRPILVGGVMVSSNTLK